MTPFADIHRVIRFLEGKVDAIKHDPSREFVRQMVAKLDEHGDSFYASPKQIKYLRALAFRNGMRQEMAPKPSRFEELKEKRRKLLNRIYEDRRRQLDADVLTVFFVPELRAHSATVTSARMRRDRSYKKAIAVANSNPKGEESNDQQTN